MHPRQPHTPLAAAIEAAVEFKHFLDVQPRDGKLFNPCGKGDPRSTATYAHAEALLAAAILENDQRTTGTGGQNVRLHAVGDVVADQSANLPANVFQLVAKIAASLEILIEVTGKRAGCCIHGSALEIGARVDSHGNEPVEAVEGQRNAVHEQGPVKVNGTTLCHGTEVR